MVVFLCGVEGAGSISQKPDWMVESCDIVEAQQPPLAPTAIVDCRPHSAINQLSRRLVSFVWSGVVSSSFEPCHEILPDIPDPIKETILGDC